MLVQIGDSAKRFFRKAARGITLPFTRVDQGQFRIMLRPNAASCRAQVSVAIGSTRDWATLSMYQTIFSLFTFAGTLFGPDDWTRDGMLSMGRRHGWDLAAYGRMSEPLIGHRGFACHHGLFGLVVPPGRPPAAWVSLAPTELQA